MSKFDGVPAPSSARTSSGARVKNVVRLSQPAVEEKEVEEEEAGHDEDDAENASASKKGRKYDLLFILFELIRRISSWFMWTCILKRFRT